MGPDVLRSVTASCNIWHPVEKDPCYRVSSKFDNFMLPCSYMSSVVVWTWTTPLQVMAPAVVRYLGNPTRTKLHSLARLAALMTLCSLLVIAARDKCWSWSNMTSWHGSIPCESTVAVAMCQLADFTATLLAILQLLPTLLQTCIPPKQR